MRLLEIAKQYVLEHLGLSENYTADLLATARRCSEFCGCLNGSIPTAEGISRWFQSALERGISPNTVLRYRRNLAAVIRFGVDVGLCEPLRLPKVKPRQSEPKAWTLEHFERVLAAVDCFTGRMQQNHDPHWWRAVLLTCYWTGARIGSILKATPKDLDLKTGVLTLRKTKNGKTVPYRLHGQALAAIERVFDESSERLFPMPFSKATFRRRLWRIIELSEMPREVAVRNLTYGIRRGALSYCWAIDPAIAQRQADHALPSTTLRHYVDQRIVLREAKTAADVLPIPQLAGGVVRKPRSHPHVRAGRNFCIREKQLFLFPIE